MLVSNEKGRPKISEQKSAKTFGHLILDHECLIFFSGHDLIVVSYKFQFSLKHA